MLKGLPAFGEKIRSIRKSMHMTQLELAEALGTDAKVISRYETGLDQMGGLMYDRLLDLIAQKGGAARLLQQFLAMTPEHQDQMLEIASAFRSLEGKSRSGAAE